MFSVYDEGTRARVVNEALEGKRGLTEIAADAGIARKTVRSWLGDHYAANPDDPRRHLVVRSSANFTRDEGVDDADDDDGNEEGEGEADDAEAADDLGAAIEARKEMAKKRTTYGKGNPHPKRDEILARYDAGETNQSELGREFGVSGGTISQWLKARDAATVKEKRIGDAKQAVIEDIKAGYAGSTLIARHKKKLTKSYIYRIQQEFREQQAKNLEQRRLNMAAAREAKKAQREAGTANGQPSLPGVEPTMNSRPEPASRRLPMAPASTRAPTSEIVRFEAQYAPESNMLGDTLAECIEERMTLRGMVTLQQRELDQLKKQLTAYQRTFGDIRR